MQVVGTFCSLLSSGCKLGKQFRRCVSAFSSSGQKLPRLDVQCNAPVFRQAVAHSERTALYDAHGQYSYHGLLLSSCRFSGDVSHYLDGRRQQRVAILCPRDASSLIAQWACWISGQIAVPMPDNVPLSLLQHYIMDSQAALVVTTREHAKTVAKLCLMTGCRLLIMDDILLEKARVGHTASTLHTIGLDAEYYERDDALIIYTTSKTGGTPKGAVFSHQAIQAQVSALVKALYLSESDGILHVLPLHHLSGCVNALACPLTLGAICVMLPNVDATQVWSHLLQDKHVNIFIATSCIYKNLIEEYEKSLQNEKERVKAVLTSKMRLMMSEYTALQPSLALRWKEISGHSLVESYGTAETGTVMTSHLAEPSKPGSVGVPLPGVEVQVVGSGGETLLVGSDEHTKVLSVSSCQGDLQVRGPGLFTRYWNQSAAVCRTTCGWFNTGDLVQYKNGVYQIMKKKNLDDVEIGGTK